MSQENNENSPNFEVIKQVNEETGREFWSARDLMPLLGYRNWRDFGNAIKRAITACIQTAIPTQYHFEGALKMVVLGSGAQRKVEDYFLSRFACYLIAQNGDPRKLQIAAAQTYFAVSTRENELLQLQRRMELREKITEYDTILLRAAEAAGVLPSNLENFQESGYKGLYGGLGTEQIKQHKEIPVQDDLLDRMGEEELAANYFRITQTNRKLRRETIQGEQPAIESHFEVGQEIRNTIERLGGDMPENLGAEPNIKPLVEEKKLSVKNLSGKPTNEVEVLHAIKPTNKSTKKKTSEPKAKVRKKTSGE
jgi:DNA-damage-inducible protein D